MIKSIVYARKRILDLEQAMHEAEEHVQRLKSERLALARLSSDKAEFSNPLEVYSIEKLRDDLLSGRKS